MISEIKNKEIRLEFINTNFKDIIYSTDSLFYINIPISILNLVLDNVSFYSVYSPESLLVGNTNHKFINVEINRLLFNNEDLNENKRI